MTTWYSIKRAFASLIWAGLWAFGCWGCVFNSPTPKLVPMDPREPTAFEWSTEAAQNAQHADGTFVATITEIQEDWTYDDPCGILSTALHHCEGTISYRVTLNDGTTKQYVYAFVHPYGEFGLHVGERAVYLWHRMPVYKYGKCRQQQAVSSAYCDYDILDTFQSDFDVLPVADSTRVASLRQSR